MKMNEFGLRHRYFHFMRLRQRLQPEEDVENRDGISNTRNFKRSKFQVH
jgi:hypothetical protein